MDALTALSKMHDISSSLKNVVKQISALSNDASAIDNDGISLLSAKSATLMRYNINLLRFAQARARGQPVESITSVLVQDGLALTKIRPLEKALQHHIDHVLKSSNPTAETSSQAKPDEHHHRPDPSAVIVNDDDAEDSAEDNLDSTKPATGADDVANSDIYHPPRLAQVAYPDDSASRKTARLQREKESLRARAFRTADVQEMINEVHGRPEEISDDFVGDGSRHTRAVRQYMKERKSRQEYEEANLTRLNETKSDKKRWRAIERAAEGPVLDGSNEFAGLMAMADRVSGKSVKGVVKPNKKKRGQRK